MATTAPPPTIAERQHHAPRPGVPAEPGYTPEATRLRRGPRQGIPRRRRLEGLAVFLVFGLLYGILGYRIISEHHVVIFDAVDRLTRAYFVWHNDPPKLAAIGFAFPPVATFVMLPFAVIKPLATSLVALPVMSAIFMAGTIVVLNRILEQADMPAIFRWVVLLVFGINPLVAFYGGNGMSEAVYLFFLAFGISAFIGWYQTEEPRYLIGAGFSLTVAMLTKYGFIIWAIATAFLIGVALARRRASRAEVEGSVIAYAAPIIYGLALWVLFNAVIVGDPFRWVELGQSDSFAVNSVGAPSGGNVAFDDVAGRLIELLVSVSPLALVVLPLLLVAFFAQRNDMALWIASFLALSIVIIAANALISDDIGLLRMRDSLPIALAAVVGGAWLYHSFEGFRLPVWGVMVAILVITLPLSWQKMKDYPYQSQEQAFVRAIETGDDQEGTNSRGGYKVGIRPESQMADFINDNVRGERARILTDNSQTFGVILLTGRPEVFFDRIDKGDQRWRQTLANPYGKVDFLLIATEAGGDLIRRRFRAASERRDPNLQAVARTDRYLLVRVPRRDPGRRGGARGGTTRTGGTATGGTTTAPAGGQPGTGLDPTLSNRDPSQTSGSGAGELFGGGQ